MLSTATCGNGELANGEKWGVAVELLHCSSHVDLSFAIWAQELCSRCYRSWKLSDGAEGVHCRNAILWTGTGSSPVSPSAVCSSLGDETAFQLPNAVIACLSSASDAPSVGGAPARRHTDYRFPSLDGLLLVVLNAPGPDCTPSKACQPRTTRGSKL